MSVITNPLGVQGYFDYISNCNSFDINNIGHSDSQESSGGDQHDISDNPANSSDEELTGNVVIKGKYM